MERGFDLRASGEPRPVAVIDALARDFKPLAVAGVLTGIVAILLALAVIGQYLYFQEEIGSRSRNPLFVLFHLDGERKIPTLYSAMLILWSGVLLGFIATVKAYRRATYAGHWLALACIFAYLAYDEATQIHEWALDFLMPYFGSDFLHFWVIPASLIVALLGLVYLRFWLLLPAATRRMFLVSALLYLGGALGFEAIGGLYAEAHGKGNFSYALLADAEEVLEMLGMIVFGHTLLTYLQSLLADRHAAARDG